MAKKEKKPSVGKGKFRLEVPLDASGIEDFKPDQKVKVMIVDSGGETTSLLTSMNKKGQGEAVFSFTKNPGQLKVIVGPESANDQELLGLDTLSAVVSSRSWLKEKKFTTRPICILHHHWHWWLNWCRTFTIRGKILCSDGSPVPGAEICAYDRDTWWWWTSEQLVGCDKTDQNGEFEIKFKWCCGWWPWWWWCHRHWHFDPGIYEIIKPVIEYDRPEFPYPIPSPIPDLEVFKDIIGDDVLNDLDIKAKIQIPGRKLLAEETKSLKSPEQDMMSLKRVDTPFNLGVVPELRKQLLEKLPFSAELAHLCIWPWHHWHPWRDCTPDIIFKATQQCFGEEKVIIDENFSNVRWNIPQTLNVTLDANSEACCLGVEDDDPVGNCVRIDEACRTLVNNIGGNFGASASPVGYLNPGLIKRHGDLPFANTIPIHGIFGSTANADYYEFEYKNISGSPSSWTSLPTPAAGGFTRWFWGAPLGSPIIDPPDWHPVKFVFQIVDGHWVIESREHFEQNNNLFSWLSGWRGWSSYTRNILIKLLTKNAIPDGTYKFRIKSWQETGGSLINPKILPYCLTTDDNYIALTIDNRIVTSAPDSYGQVCGSGTVHTCTSEPGTGFVSVKIIHPDLSEVLVDACTQAKINLSPSTPAEFDWLQIDFFAHDPDGHLSFFTLNATYGDSLARNLLDQPGASLQKQFVPGPGIADFAAKDYKDALLLPVPATAPHWRGGGLRLLVPAHEAFPETCCYQLELRAHKRTIVNCSSNLWGHTNFSERSFMIEAE